MTFAACGCCGNQSVQLGFEVARRNFQQGSVQHLSSEAVNVLARRGALLQLKGRKRGFLCSNSDQCLHALERSIPIRRDHHCGKNAWSGASLHFSAWGGWREKQGNASVRGKRAIGLKLPASVSGGEPNEATSSAGEFVYQPFAEFAHQELTSRPEFSSLLLKEEFRTMISKDGAARIDNIGFASPKIRLFRIACIQAGSSIQILNVAGFAKEEYDLPIFCAEFVSVLNKNIIVLDLNPVFDTKGDKDYKARYYDELMPMANKYTEVLPWGDKLTAESLQFFSPLVLWTKAQKEDVSRYLFPAFQEYFLAWLKLVDLASPAVNAATIAKNEDAQQHYLSWRATKDPGLPLLTKFYGEQLAERYVKEFLFNGLKDKKSFLDYFPEYRLPDGGISKQRSMIGKSFETRPWSKDGSFSPI